MFLLHKKFYFCTNDNFFLRLSTNILFICASKTLRKNKGSLFLIRLALLANGTVRKFHNGVIWWRS